ncbi:MAG: HAD-IA family hydrolase [Candidatus Micrarchaeia archaeon]
MLFIFDFDSTLAELNVDWSTVKKEVLDYAESIGAKTDPSTHLVNISNNISENEETKKEVDRIFRKHESRATKEGNFLVYPSTVPTLNALRERGHKTAIASNNNEETIREVVKVGKLPVDAIRGRNSVSRPKPFPDMLNSLMEELQTPKNETFMTGDNFWDEGSGKAAGVKTFIIKPGTLDISLFDGII